MTAGVARDLLRRIQCCRLYVRQAHSISICAFARPRTWNCLSPSLLLIHAWQNSTILPRRPYLCWASSLAIFLRNAITTGLSSRCATENDHAFYWLDSTLVCEGRLGNPQAALRTCGKSSR